MYVGLEMNAVAFAQLAFQMATLQTKLSLYLRFPYASTSQMWK